MHVYLCIYAYVYLHILYTFIYIYEYIYIYIHMYKQQAGLFWRSEPLTTQVEALPILRRNPKSTKRHLSGSVR